MDTKKEGFLRSPRVIMKSHLPAAVCPRPGFGPRSVWLQNPWSFQGDILSSVSKPSYSPNIVHGTLEKPLSVTYGILPVLLLAPHGAVCTHFLCSQSSQTAWLSTSDVSFVQLHLLSVSGRWFPASGCSKPCSIVYYLCDFILRSLTSLYMKGRWYHL